MWCADGIFTQKKPDVVCSCQRKGEASTRPHSTLLAEVIKLFLDGDQSLLYDLHAIVVVTESSAQAQAAWSSPACASACVAGVLSWLAGYIGRSGAWMGARCSAVYPSKSFACATCLRRLQDGEMNVRVDSETFELSDALSFSEHRQFEVS